jgi:hypothetical protein
MNQIRYTIVIEDGVLSGISQHTGNLDAVPLSLAELTELVPSINSAALAALSEKDGKAKQSELDLLQ